MNKNDVGIMIVDDELIVRDSLTKWFREDGYRVEAAENAATALKKLQAGCCNLMLVDIKMPGMDGIELLERVKEIDENVIVIIITAFASVDTAVKALKQGAYDYLTKPIDPDHLDHVVEKALKQHELTLENLRLRGVVSELAGAEEIVGESPEIKKVLDLVHTVAPTDTTVMIRGESGTGKELVARAIHNGSARRFFPIVTVNCGALPAELLERPYLDGRELAEALLVQYKDLLPAALHDAEKWKINPQLSRVDVGTVPTAHLGEAELRVAVGQLVAGLAHSRAGEYHPPVLRVVGA